MVKIFSLLAEILKSMDKKRDVQPNTSDMPELEKHTRKTISKRTKNTYTRSSVYYINDFFTNYCTLCTYQKH